MPTIDIPDKICPHCGGIRWIQSLTKKTISTGEIKFYNTFRCSKKNIENGNKYRKSHIEHHREIVNKRLKFKRNNCLAFAEKHRESVRIYHRTHREKRKIYRDKWASLNPEKNANYFRKSSRKQIERLTDYYVSRRVIGTQYELKKEDIPQELIQLKRKQLLLKRKSKQNGKN